MQNRSDTPGEGLDPKALQALMDAIEGECDGLAIDEQQAASILEYVIAASPSVIGSDTAGLPSDCAETVECLSYLMNVLEVHADKFPVAPHILAHVKKAREAIAALSRAPEAVVVKPLDWKGRYAYTGIPAYYYALDDKERAWFQAEYKGRIISALAAPPAPQPALALIEEFRPTHRHLKSGGFYQTLDIATNATNAQNGQKMVLYRNAEGRHFVREWDEFHDGRFEHLASAKRFKEGA